MQRWDPENVAQDPNSGGERSILLLGLTWSRVRSRLARQPSHRPRPRPSAAPSSTARTSNVGAACSASRPSCSRASLVQAMGARAGDLPQPAARQLCPSAPFQQRPSRGRSLDLRSQTFSHSGPSLPCTEHAQLRRAGRPEDPKSGAREHPSSQFSEQLLLCGH